MTTSSKAGAPVLALTLGDLHGIGPEVTLRALADERLLTRLTPVIYASGRTVKSLRALYLAKSDALSFVIAPAEGPFTPGRINVVNCWEQDEPLSPGQPTAWSGQAAFLSLAAATAAALSRTVEGIVTAPIAKEHMPAAFRETGAMGHTDFLSKAAGDLQVLMIMAAPSLGLRVALATDHVPLKAVSGRLTIADVQAKIKLLARTLRDDFGTLRPRIAVMGLNPHAGEGGLIGQEDQQVILPAVRGIDPYTATVAGPLPADGFFGRHAYRDFDAVLACYHDQGLIPFKMIAMDEGVNYTGGLPFIRTSPAHGTAFDIAGTGKASHDSMTAALLLAAESVMKRRQVRVLSA